MKKKNLGAIKTCPTQKGGREVHNKLLTVVTLWNGN